MTKEEKKAHNATYRAANREKIKAQRLTYYAATAEKAKAYQKTYYAANAEEIKAGRRAYRKANPEKMKAADAAWYKPEKKRASDRRRKYGISQADFQQMVLTQKNTCRVCEEIFSKEPCVDHCHKTKKVRGLLCGRCNKALGLLKDSPAAFRRAAEYLENVG